MDKRQQHLAHKGPVCRQGDSLLQAGAVLGVVWAGQILISLYQLWFLKAPEEKIVQLKQENKHAHSLCKDILESRARGDEYGHA